MQDYVLNVNRLKRKIVLEKNNLKTILWPTIIIIAVVLVDQLSKEWAVSYLADKFSVDVIGKFLMFTLVYNEGGALGTSFGPSTYYLISSSLILLFVLFYLYQSRKSYAMSLPLAFIAGGAIGNIIDRIKIGKVVDFIDVDFFDINLFGFHLERWWTFNIADSAISCAIVFLIFHIIFVQGRQDKQNILAVENDTGSTPSMPTSSDETPKT